MSPATSRAVSPEGVAVDGPAFLVNRELSWLEFNQRVLAEAFDARNPLLERVRFLAITANNLDEFFMIRVSGLRQQWRAGVTTPSPDGLTPREQLDAIDHRTRRMFDEMTRCWTQLHPLLEKEKLTVRDWAGLGPDDRVALGELFREQIFPVLTPLAVDPAHPFPYMSNLSLNLAVVVRDPDTERELFARVKVPTAILPRFVRLRESDESVPLEQVVAAHLDSIFPGMDIVELHPFRVIRDADIEIEEDEADDLLDEIELGIRRRRLRSVVHLSVAASMPSGIRKLLVRQLDLLDEDVLVLPELLGFAELDGLLDVDRPDLFFPRWKPLTPAVFADHDGERMDMFAVLDHGDVLVHHPYDSFSDSVEAFVLQAIDDPHVVAIKHTMYRTAQNSAIMRALIGAAESGKEVVVVVEIKARFDEERNIEWAKRLEAVGAHVCYGLVGLKTHAKCALVVRREAGGLRRYVHIGTGNYNAATARLYEDMGLLTADPELGSDASDLFNLLTGHSRQKGFRRLLVSPRGIRTGLSERIEREIRHASEGRSARIRFKMNSLVDPAMIRLLYGASQAGVDVDLVVRGICCLTPGIPGVSDRIHVRSVIGRFLEHSRIYHFHNDGDDEYLIGSADLMPRNLDRRVESLTPVSDPGLQRQIGHILDTNLADTRQAWAMHSDGSWTRSDDSAHPGTHDILMRERRSV